MHPARRQRALVFLSVSLRCDLGRADVTAVAQHNRLWPARWRRETFRSWLLRAEGMWSHHSTVL